MSKLKIESNSIFRIKVEDVSEFYDSAFGEQYINAANSLNKILNYENVEDKEDKEDEYNNIIAFVGERGSGKTSSMVSFKNSLKNSSICEIANLTNDNIKDSDELKKFGELKKLYRMLGEGRKFYTLDTIDPSMFNNKDSIVEIVVAEMFKKFREIDCEKEYTSKYELVKMFELVYKDLRILNKDKESLFEENIDNLEVLTDLSSAISLKNSMKKLVKCYLKYMNDNGHKDCLIISIDDLDMNIEAGEKMLEDIRKYLIIPQVAILLAVKLEQIEEIVKQRNIIHLQYLEKFYKDTEVINQNIYSDSSLKEFNSQLNNKVKKYIEKLIPFNRRIYMPNLINMEFLNIEISIGDYQESSNTIHEAIVKLFKYRLNYFIITPNHINSILPKNLRGIVDLIVFLATMKSESKDDLYNNLIKIKDYYTYTIIEQVNDIKKEEFLKEILYCKNSTLNKKLLLFLNNELIIERNKNRVRLDESYNYIYELDKYKQVILSENISLGDIITWIKLYESFILVSGERDFIEIVKSIYSLRLLEIYYNNPNELLNITLVNFVGKYLEVVDNHNKNKFEMLFILPKDKIELLRFNEPNYENLSEQLKDTAIIRENGYYSFNSLNNILLTKENFTKLGNDEFDKLKEQKMCILNKVSAFYSILDIGYRGEKSKSSINKFLRKRSQNELNYKGKSKFDYFFIQPLNMIGSYIYNDLIDDGIDDSRELFIINNWKKTSENRDTSGKKENNTIKESIIFILNLDYFMQLLFEFERKLQNRRWIDANDYYEILSYVEDNINKTHKLLKEEYDLNILENTDKLIGGEYKKFISENIGFVNSETFITKISLEERKEANELRKLIYNYIGSTTSSLRSKKRTIKNKSDYMKIVNKISLDLNKLTDIFKNTDVEEEIRGICEKYVEKLKVVKDYDDTSNIIDNIIEGRNALNKIKNTYDELNVVEE